MFDIRQRQFLREIDENKHERRTNSIALSADEEFLIAGSADGYASVSLLQLC